MTHEVVQEERMALVVDDFKTIPSPACEFLEAASFIVLVARLWIEEFANLCR
ncbi:MAG: hypothetical protein ABSC04_21740 [Syntrophobacteraceae bacterium]|jgi:hypothetical protein